jgi:hypothetical protein
MEYVRNNFPNALKTVMFFIAAEAENQQTWGTGFPPPRE